MAAAGRSGWHRRQAQVAVRERLAGVARWNGQGMASSREEEPVLELSSQSFCSNPILCNPIGWRRANDQSHASPDKAESYLAPHWLFNHS